MANLDALKSFNIGSLEMKASTADLDHAVLYLHGFPGPFEKLPAGESRIVDLLWEKIAQKYDFYYPLYTLIRDQDFDFQKSLAHGAQALSFIRSRKAYKSITLVAQSWGAVIGLALSSEFNFRKVILITPFLEIPTGSAATEVVRYYSQKFPALLPPEKVSQFAKQLELLSMNNSPRRELERTASPVSVYASELDEVISLKKIRDVMSVNPSAKLKVLPEQTHKVEDRSEIASLVLSELFANEPK